MSYKIKNSLSLQIKYCINNFLFIFKLSYFDIILRYRRTIIGPLWTILSTSVITIVIAGFWSIIFKEINFEYLLHVYIGFIIWNLIQNMTIGSVNLLTQEHNELIRNTNIPISVLILRHTLRSIIIMSYFFPIILILLIFRGKTEIINIPLIITALIMIFIIFFLLSSIISILCSRYRDLIELLSLVMGSSLLITPVIWDSKMLVDYQKFVYLNPFAIIIDSLRKPLLGQDINLILYLYLIGIILSLFIILNFIYKKKGNLIVFWSN
jgi:ABC-type polysaccharide/polyol phosphate export permease